MFYYVRMEDMIPEDHLLRLVDRHIDFSFIRDKVKHLYSHTGRPSIDPEVLLRMLCIGYLYGITSERRLCEDVRMHIGYRWFIGLNLKDPHIPIVDHRRHNGIGIYTIKDFTYDGAKDIFICPEGKDLKYWGFHRHSRQQVYRTCTKDCAVCRKKDACI
jgi:hypothetical protein